MKNRTESYMVLERFFVEGRKSILSIFPFFMACGIKSCKKGMFAGHEWVDKPLSLSLPCTGVAMLAGKGVSRAIGKRASHSVAVAAAEARNPRKGCNDGRAWLCGGSFGLGS